MNTFEKVHLFKCKKCKRTYEKEPAHCICNNKLDVGKVVGVFKLIEKLNDTRWLVTCLLCDVETELHSTNIHRQISCGCKPRHITYIDSTEEQVRYFCRRCNNSHVQNFPVIEWCCNGD